MSPSLKLPIPAAVAALSVLCLLELFLRPITDPVGLVIAVHLVIFGTLDAQLVAQLLEFLARAQQGADDAVDLRRPGVGHDEDAHHSAAASF